MEKVVEALTTVGVTAKQMPLLASLEIAAAGGIIIGFWVSPLGIAAASGSVLYFVGAMAAHVRVRDFKGLSGPLVPLILSVAALVLRVASA
jgi:hypothetical protein